MFKSRRVKAEEEARQEENYRPTKDLEAHEDKPTYEIPWTGLIIVGVLLALVVLFVILIFAVGAPK